MYVKERERERIFDEAGRKERGRERDEIEEEKKKRSWKHRGQ